MTSLSNSTLADRIAALDWSGVSLQHQLAVAAAVETLRKQDVPAAVENVREAWSGFQMVREAVETLGPVGALPASEHLDGPTFTHEAEVLVAGIAKMQSTPAAGLENVLPFPALRAPSAELLRGAEYNERRVTLTNLTDGSTAATALCSRGERRDWIVETTCEFCQCDPERVAFEEDTVTVDGLPVFSC